MPFPMLSSILQQQDQPYDHMTSIDWFWVGNWPDILSPYPGAVELEGHTYIRGLDC